MQTFATVYNPAFAARSACPWSSVTADGAGRAQDHRAARALELKANAIVNLGIGMPEGVAARRGRGARHRPHDADRRARRHRRRAGRRACDFGAAINTQAIIDQTYQFDFYDGGGLDLAVPRPRPGRPARQPQRQPLRPAARRRRRLHQHQPERAKVVFVGTFTAGGLKWQVEDGRPAHRRRKAGRASSCEKVEHRTFSAARYAAGAGKPVLYVTERCVFRLTAAGLELIEVAPGIDIERDILAHMDFPPDRRRPAAHGRAHLPAGADGPERSAAQPRSHRPARLRPGAQHPVPQLRGRARPPAPRTSAASGTRSRHCASGSAGGSRWS